MSDRVGGSIDLESVLRVGPIVKEVDTELVQIADLHCLCVQG